MTAMSEPITAQSVGYNTSDCASLIFGGSTGGRLVTIWLVVVKRMSRSEASNNSTKLASFSSKSTELRRSSLILREGNSKPFT